MEKKMERKERYIELMKNAMKSYEKDKNPNSSEVVSAYKRGYYLGFLHGVSRACFKDDLLTADDTFDIINAESELYMKYIHED